MRSTIATKIFCVAFVITLLMASISLVDLYISKNADEFIEVLVDRYIQAYGSIARLNVRSLEQAIKLREYIILSSHHEKNTELNSASYKKEIDDLSLQFSKELNNARKLLDIEVVRKAHFNDVATLNNINDKLDYIQTEQLALKNISAVIINNLSSGKSLSSEDFLALSMRRSEFNNYIDTTRRTMLAAAMQAGAQTIAQGRRAYIISLILLFFTSMLAIITALLLARHLARPVNRLLEGTKQISKGDLTTKLPIISLDEIGDLTNAFNEMVVHLSEGKRARDTFGQYVDPRIVKTLIDMPDLVRTQGARRMMTVMFCDVKGFTHLSESMSPEETVDLMNRYCTLMSEAVHANNGVIDKFIGDAVMAYWGRPFVSDDAQSQLAVESAIEQLQKIKTLKPNNIDIYIRIGIATGDVVVGSIGSDLLRNYTVIGDTVNVASRLEGVSKLYGTSILITENTAKYIDDSILLREIDKLIFMGKTQKITIFEVIGFRKDMTESDIKLKTNYEAGLNCYYAQQWESAIQYFELAKTCKAADSATLVMLERVSHFLNSPPPHNWDGTWIMETK